MNQSAGATFNRRNFFTGVVAGGTAGAGSWLLAPAQAHEALLPLGTHLSYAQNGEDLIVASLFRVLKIDKPSYVDIGAYDPILGSNTYHFWKRGGRGILIEPNPDLTAKLKTTRPGDVVLPIGIGVDETPHADFYMCSWPQLNTFDKDDADNFEKRTSGQAKLLKVIQVPLVNINKVLAEHLDRKAPDYLSIDAEGFEIYILKSLDWSIYRPAIIATEHSQDPAKRQVLMNLMSQHGYHLRGLTYVNSIFVDGQKMPGLS